MCGIVPVLLNGVSVAALTWMLRGDLNSALFAPPLLTLFLASFFVLAVGLTSAALPDLALLPLDGFRAGVSSKVRLQLHAACPDHVTFPTGLVAL